jgi:multidrug resistance efflux pump
MCILYKKICCLVVLVSLAACVPQPQKELKPGEKAIILTGKVFAFQDAEVASPITATVEKILVEPGTQVKEGQILLRLDESGAKADVSRAEAALAIARATLTEARAGSSEAVRAEAEADVERFSYELELQKSYSTPLALMTEYEQSGIMLENAKAKVERMYALYARKLASRPEVESAQNEYAEALRRHEGSRETLERKVALKDSDARVAESRYKAARARLAAVTAAGAGSGRLQIALAQTKQAEADLEKVRSNLGQSIIKAPMGGVVTEVTAQAGNKIYEGRPLVKVSDISRVKIQADLSPGLLPFVKVGQKAKIAVNSVPPATVDSSIATIKTIADPRTQSLEVAFILPNPGFKFQPGFTARVEIPVEPGQAKDLPAKEQKR